MKDLLIVGVIIVNMVLCSNCSDRVSTPANSQVPTPTPDAMATAVTAPSPATQLSPYPEADIDVNGIRVDTPYKEIERLIGKPDRVKYLGKDECTDGMTRTLYYPGLNIDLESDEKGRNYSVVAFEVTSSKWVIGGKFHIGDGPDAVNSRYGAPLSDSLAGHISYVMKDNLGSVDFDFKDGRLVKATLWSTLC